ncbi:DUF2797 domain-containing protein [Streptomyces sp. NBC_00083]|uniref:DUF2797 domain-containing protein n=1 Tax=Streptomyces sp. NBC_00083 TaxID=2975647 RepID=UPI002254A9CC|nr:DUF2797 domain-containing protein [Streptomyces sp. NBC_00083]MCX5387676.1 DUF2797 domain-containing protein [Streptomyces sp. NBC_00083]
MGRVWWCSGVRWGAGGVRLGWGEGRESALGYGQGIAFRVVGARRCVGARGNVCPVAATVPGRSTQARCGECARLDRAHSVAADTFLDDPRTYRVYLAWFGAGMVKVGITAEERGPARLLEQGAVAFGWLGRGPLMAARRCEELLRAALGVPDRIAYAEKRAVRAGLPGVAERAAEVAALHARAVALPGWPESLERIDCEVVDHAEAFGLAGLAPASGVVVELVDGGVVGGRLVAAAGPDLHLDVAATGIVVLDTRLMRGWGLTAAGSDGERGGSDPAVSVAVTVPVRQVPRPGGVQDQLF